MATVGGAFVALVTFSCVVWPAVVPLLLLIGALALGLWCLFGGSPRGAACTPASAPHAAHRAQTLILSDAGPLETGRALAATRTQRPQADIEILDAPRIWRPLDASRGLHGFRACPPSQALGEVFRCETPSPAETEGPSTPSGSMSLSDELKRAATPAAATQEREALWRLEIRSLKREVQKLLRDLSMSEDAREGALQAAAEREQELESRQQELTAQQIGLNHHYEGWQRGAAELRAQRDAWAARHRQTSRSLQLLQQQQCTWERELHLAETNLQRLAVRLAASQRREARYTEREQELEELLAEQIAQTASLQRKSRRLERGWVRDSQRLSAEVAQEKARADEACDALAERPRRPSWRP